MVKIYNVSEELFADSIAAEYIFISVRLSHLYMLFSFVFAKNYVFVS